MFDWGVHILKLSTLVAHLILCVCVCVYVCVCRPEKRKEEDLDIIYCKLKVHVSSLQLPLFSAPHLSISPLSPRSRVFLSLGFFHIFTPLLPLLDLSFSEHVFMFLVSIVNWNKNELSSRYPILFSVWYPSYFQFSCYHYHLTQVWQ